jgi:hypothetical protein
MSRYAALRHNLHASVAQVFGDNWYLLSDLQRVNILLSGSTRLNISENRNIFKSVQYYIKQTERFSTNYRFCLLLCACMEF